MVWDYMGLRNFGLDMWDLAKCMFDTNPLTNLCMKNKTQQKKSYFTQQFTAVPYFFFFCGNNTHIVFFNPPIKQLNQLLINYKLATVNH